MKIRLLLIDDHPIVGAGLAQRYRQLDPFSVVAMVDSIEAGLTEAARGKADVAVLDVYLTSPITPRDVRALCAHVRVVLFSGHAGDPYVSSLLSAGAFAANDKSGPLGHLDAAITKAFAAPLPVLSGEPAGDQSLTAREHEVYQALARCLTPKEIAATLSIAQSTVYCHVENIRRKLGLRTAQEIGAHGRNRASGAKRPR